MRCILKDLEKMTVHSRGHLLLHFIYIFKHQLINTLLNAKQKGTKSLNRCMYLRIWFDFGILGIMLCPCLMWQVTPLNAWSMSNNFEVDTSLLHMINPKNITIATTEKTVPTRDFWVIFIVLLEIELLQFFSLVECMHLHCILSLPISLMAVLKWRTPLRTNSWIHKLNNPSVKIN